MKRFTATVVTVMVVVFMSSSSAHAGTDGIDLSLNPTSIHFENALPGVPQSQIVALTNTGEVDAQISPVFSGLEGEGKDIHFDFKSCTGEWVTQDKAMKCDGVLQTDDIVAKAPSEMELLITVTLDKNLTSADYSMAWSGQIVFEGLEVIPVAPPGDKDGNTDEDSAPIFVPLNPADDLPPTGVDLQVPVLIALGLILVGLLLRRRSERTSDE